MFSFPHARMLIAAAMLGAFVPAASQTLPGGPLPPQPPPRPGSEAAPTPGFSGTTPESFAAWRTRFRARALAVGISSATLDAAFAGVAPNARVLERDNRQPEFTRPIWEYLDSAVSDDRIATGRGEATAKAAILERIEARYGVDGETVLAIWGIESAYGDNFGSIPVIESMATLAHEGRRKTFAEMQLIAALRILQAGDIATERMVGSWAGAMGHTQFIPTSFLEYAVDFTGDGKRDLWAPDAVDALASTANYLARFGWRQGAPAAVEATLPQGFDHRLADGATQRATAEWAALGVRAEDGALPAGENVAILMPAGAHGPAFATYPNFRVIKRYNNSTSYALAVAYLAREIAGRPGIRGVWPRRDRSLSRTEKLELQERLTAMGFDTGGIDGLIGPNSRAAVRRFQESRGLVPDGYVSGALLAAVRADGG